MSSNEQPRRSFSNKMLLKRSKSGDLGSKGRKKGQTPEPQKAPQSPPRLPALYQPDDLQTFGGDTNRPDSLAIMSNKADHSFHRYPPRPASRGSIDPRKSTSSPSYGTAPPVPPVPTSYDPYARTESMTNRGRYSYASSAISSINSPRKVRRRKDPTPFNILIVGSRGSGKTSFLEFLKTSLALPPTKRSQRSTEIEQEVTSKVAPSGNFIPHYIESEIEGERVGLTIWDSEGLEKNVVDLQLREMSTFLESKFEETFAEEMKVVRSPGVQDTHIHAVFLILDPSRLDRNIAAAKTTSNGLGHGHRVVGGLDEDLDLQVMRTLQGKTTVIPVISKADTITTAHMAVLKKTVWSSLKSANFDPLAALGLDEEDDESSVSSDRIDEEDEEDEPEAEKKENVVENGHDNHESEQDDAAADDSADELPIQGGTSTETKRRSTNSIRKAKEQEQTDEIPILPMSIISPDIYEPGVVGRKFPWGFANPYDAEHCDFTRLKEAVFTEWRGELREASREQWYEGWRTNRLNKRDGQGGRRR